MSSRPAPTRPLVLLEAWVAALVTVAGAALSVSMPRLVSEGGIAQAQDFLNLSPVFFPRLAFGMMALLGLIHLGRAVRQLAGSAPAEGGESWLRTYQNVIAIAALVILYSTLLPWLGFGTASAIGIATITMLLGSRRWWEILPLALLSPIIIRFVFERLLLISLPRSEFDVIADPEEALMQLLVRLLRLLF